MTNSFFDRPLLFTPNSTQYNGVRIPPGYIVGVGRDHPRPKVAHLYKGEFHNPGNPMCPRGYNREDGYSIWRNPKIPGMKVCRTCLRRANHNLPTSPAPETYD